GRRSTGIQICLPVCRSSRPTWRQLTRRRARAMNAGCANGPTSTTPRSEPPGSEPRPCAMPTRLCCVISWRWWTISRPRWSTRGGGNGKPLVEGVELVLKSLLDVLERHGVTRVAAKGSRFDPAHHEAMAHVETTEHEPNSVVQEHQPGYRLNERLLRPALVSVAKAPDSLVKDRPRD